MGNTYNPGELEEIARPLLPVFFVLDTSGSMNGAPISMLNHAMEETLEVVGQFANENADALIKIGILEFNSGAKWAQPKGLEELEDFVYNPLQAGGLTDIGAALDELDDKLSRKKFISSTTGYCAPIIIFMTDGQPTDNWQQALENIKNNNKWFKFAIKIGFAVGDDARADIISQIVGNSEAVIQTSDLAIFGRLLQQIAIQSVMVGSKSHVSGESSNGGDIVQGVIEETGSKEKVITGTDLSNINVTNKIDGEDGGEITWGPDDWE